MIEFKPTYLYIKQHIITGKLYFGKTIKPDPIKYKGSGKYWLRHLKTHGEKEVETLWYCLFVEENSCIEFALMFSQQQNIIKSENWLNLKAEDGLNIGSNSRINFHHTQETKEKMSVLKTGVTHSEETKKLLSNIQSNRSEEWRNKISLANKGRVSTFNGRSHSEESRRKMSIARIGNTNSVGNKAALGCIRSEETRKKISEANKGKHPIVICPHCLKEGGRNNMYRWHFNNCKFKEK